MKRGWRERSLDLFGPGVLSGVSLGDWFRLLLDNRFRVHPACLPRAATITWSAATNSLVRRIESWRHGRAVAPADLAPPLFVLGHWRSGTTLLHELLGLDDRFAFPSLYQVMYPHTFLSTERLGARVFRALSPKHRPHDNMRLDPDGAWEDEFVHCAGGFRTPYLAWAFPARAAHYDRYLTLRDVTPDELERWAATLRNFLQKVSHRHGGKPLVLKSPPHTCRIRLLLELFPGARFVHVHRDPYAVYQSSLNMHARVLPACRLQRADRAFWAERVLRQYVELYDAFFAERALIPAGCFHEVAFEAIERDPVGQLRTLYAALGLPDFSHAEPAMRRYVDSLAGYRKNVFPPLAPEERARVAREWRRGFDAWGYEV